MKKIFKIAAYVVGGLLLFLVALAGVTQTQYFRDRLRSMALDKLREVLIAEVSLGEVHGNLVTGFTVDSLALTLDGVDIVRANEVGLRYNLLEVPGRVISVSSLSLTRPTIQLLRDRAGSWNFERMVRPTPPDSTPSGPLNWSIVVDNLSIRQGIVVLIDSTALLAVPPPSDTDMVYKNVRLEDFNLAMSARIVPEELRASIGSLSFESVQTPFSLRRLAGDFLVTPTQSRVEGLVITTDRSNVRLDAAMRQFNLLGGISLDSLRHADVDLELHAHEIDFGELKTLLPPVDFLEGAASLDLAASGEFGNLGIQGLRLEEGRNLLSGRGRISNLHDPRNLVLNVRMTQSQIYGPDVRTLMPRFNIPAFAGLGTADLEIEFDGKPLDFSSKVSMKTAAGRVQAQGTLKIGGPHTLRYNGDATVENLDLAKVLEEEELASELNGSAHIEGEGVALRDLASSLRVQIEPSRFRGLEMQPSTLSITAAGRRLEGRFDLAMGAMGAHFNAVLDEGQGEEPQFAVDGNITAVDLAQVFNDPTYNSNLTLVMNARGSGLSLDVLNGDFYVDFSSSRYREYQLSGGNMHLVLDQHDPVSKKLTLQSNIADFSLEGAFDLSTLGKLVVFEVGSVRSTLRDRLAVLDTALSVRRVRPVVHREQTAEQLRSVTPANAAFALTLKDLEPLSVMAGERVFNGTGTLTGSVHGDYNDLSLRGRLDLNDFFYGDVASGMLVQNGAATLVMNHLTPDDPFKTMDLRFNVSAAKVHLNSTEMDSVDVTFGYQNEAARYMAQGRINRDMTGIIEGEGRIAGDSLAFLLDNLQWSYRDFAWHAEPGLSIAIDRMGLRVGNAVFRRDSQQVSLGGRLYTDGRLDARLTAHRVDLQDLRFVLEPEEHTGRYVGFEGVANFTLDAYGTVRQPLFTASVDARNVAYGRVPFGPVTGTVAYRNSRLRIDAQGGTSTTGAGHPAVMVQGSLPLHLSAVDSTTLLADSTLDLAIRSDGMQMSILDPLLPTFEQLSGLLRCDLTLGGTSRHPSMHGSLGIANATFLFLPNNIRYTLDGTFEAEGGRVKVVDAIIRNVPEDVRGGRRGETHVTGDFALSNFVPGDFNLTATGQLLVVKETTRQSSLSVYGNLFVEIAPSGLHLTGSIERSLLKGSLHITNSSLIFPPTVSSIAEESPLSVPLVYVDDTTRVVEPSTRLASMRYFGTNGSGTNGRSMRPQKGGEDGDATSFVDGIRYDLDIEIGGGNSQIQMMFNPATNEELVATMEGTFTIAGDGKQWFGDLTVSRAYYNFFKRFDAEGTIRYTGDFLNPELDITGRYKGTRVLEDSLEGRTTENVIVTINITGSRFKPKIDMGMTIDDVDYFNYKGAKSNDVQSDAISFILAGTFPLTGPERRQVATNTGIESSLLTGATSPLTGVLSEFLRSKVGFIEDVELRYNAREGETLTQRTDIRLSGTAWSGYWRYGGNILYDPVENANFSIIYSFGTIFNNAALRNLMFELERKVEANVFGPSNEFKRVNSARLFYRFSF